MSQVTRKELDTFGALVSLEAAMHEKFAHYANACSEEHVRKLCQQLADRSRQHLTALVDAVENAESYIQ